MESDKVKSETVPEQKNGTDTAATTSESSVDCKKEEEEVVDDKAEDGDENENDEAEDGNADLEDTEEVDTANDGEEPNDPETVGAKLKSDPDAEIEGKDKDECNTTAKPKPTHPYQEIIDNFVITDEHCQPLQSFKRKPMNKFGLTFVETKVMLIEAVEQMLASPTNYLGVAIKHTIGYQNRLSYILISTLRFNYFIDAFKLHESLHVLNDIFTNPNIVKIFPNAYPILKYLQLNYGLYFVNIFDVKKAFVKLDMKFKSFRAFLEERYSVKPMKFRQPPKWQTRPLPDNLKVLAVQEVHYLPSIYVNLKNALIEKNLIKDFLVECSLQCTTHYDQENALDKIFQPELVRSLGPNQVYALTKLEEWRNNLAKKKKKPPVSILPNWLLKQLTYNMPQTRVKILKICKTFTLPEARLESVYQIMVEAGKVIGPVCETDLAGNPKPKEEEKKPADPKMEVNLTEIITESLKKEGFSDETLQAKITEAVRQALGKNDTEKNKEAKGKKRPFEGAAPTFTRNVKKYRPGPGPRPPHPNMQTVPPARRDYGYEMRGPPAKRRLSPPGRRETWFEREDQSPVRRRSPINRRQSPVDDRRPPSLMDLQFAGGSASRSYDGPATFRNQRPSADERAWKRNSNRKRGGKARPLGAGAGPSQFWSGESNASRPPVWSHEEFESKSPWDDQPRRVSRLYVPAVNRPF